MSTALREHDDLIASAVTEAGGVVVKNEGDGAMAAFTDASSSVDAAVSIQRAVAERVWPEIGRLRIRMGFNSGVAEARDGDYFGPEVIRAARLCSAAHAGQIVATRSVVELARRASWVDLGRRGLRGFAAPVEIHQVVADGIDARFPALRTLDATPNTLPRFRTEFFGRDEEIAAIGDLLSRQGRSAARTTVIPELVPTRARLGHAAICVSHELHDEQQRLGNDRSLSSPLDLPELAAPSSGDD
jgi:hypothetical protein